LTRIASISCCLYKACAAAIGVHAKESIDKLVANEKGGGDFETSEPTSFAQERIHILIYHYQELRS
jgi:hypothetical protein